MTLLPKTRSGKTLRRSIQALAEGRDPGDLTTIEDPGALEQIKDRPCGRMKTRPMLTLDDCRKITAAAEAEARKNNWNVVIAILDDGGHLLHLARMDGATPANARIAVEKGRTAAISRRSTLACGRSASRRGRKRCSRCPASRRCRAACRSWSTAPASAASASPACSRTRTSRSPHAGIKAVTG